MVADKISEEDTKNKEWLVGVFKYGVSVLSLTLIIGATILGVNIKGKNIPNIKNRDFNMVTIIESPKMIFV